MNGVLIYLLLLLLVLLAGVGGLLLIILWIYDGIMLASWVHEYNNKGKPNVTVVHNTVVSPVTPQYVQPVAQPVYVATAPPQQYIVQQPSQ